MFIHIKEEAKKKRSLHTVVQLKKQHKDIKTGFYYAGRYNYRIGFKFII